MDKPEFSIEIWMIQLSCKVRLYLTSKKRSRLLNLDLNFIKMLPHNYLVTCLWRGFVPRGSVHVVNIILNSNRQTSEGGWPCDCSSHHLRRLITMVPNSNQMPFDNLAGSCIPAPFWQFLSLVILLALELSYSLLNTTP